VRRSLPLIRQPGNPSSSDSGRVAVVTDPEQTVAPGGSSLSHRLLWSGAGCPPVPRDRRGRQGPSGLRPSSASFCWRRDSARARVGPMLPMGMAHFEATSS
jgi:hypothetical protein